jgi:uncharacterized membrane protein YfcA
MLVGPWASRISQGVHDRSTQPFASTVAIMTWFYLAILLVGLFSGATASVVGFGIGSLLTPLLAVRYGTSVAVAAVTLPHALATAVRCWRLRANIDRQVLVRFGLLSAAGALAGALLYTRLGPTALTRVLGALLLLTALAQLTGWSSRWRPHGSIVTVFGLLSGFFGGVAGNQGGLRAAALTAFRLSPAAFVATATATGLMVDIARTPVYLWMSGRKLLPLAVPIALAAIGVLIGTVLGERVLLGLSARRFGQVVGVAIGVLGVWLLVGAT